MWSRLPSAAPVSWARLPAGSQKGQEGAITHRPYVRPECRVLNRPPAFCVFSQGACACRHSVPPNTMKFDGRSIVLRFTAFFQMPYRILCNDEKRKGVKISPDLVFGLYSYVSLHKIRYGISLFSGGHFWMLVGHGVTLPNSWLLRILAASENGWDLR
jgi:hypothetical protein